MPRLPAHFWSRRTVAGAAAVIVVAGAMAVMLIAGRSGAATASEGLAGMGEARHASLTVDVPPPVMQRIYGAPGAQGRPIVAIDAGHGGHDPGAIGVSGQVSEKQITLMLAGELRDALVQRGRLRVLLSREDDRFLTLDERATIARNAGAALFISLHADSAHNPLARGASIYSLSDVASDAEAARMAQAQNAAFAQGPRESGAVNALLADLAMRSEMTASADFAERLVRKSAGRFALRPEPHRFAAFHVLKKAEMPAVLFEAGYLSNADDEVLLRDPKHREGIVSALAQAIEADVAARSHR